MPAVPANRSDKFKEITFVNIAARRGLEKYVIVNSEAVEHSRPDRGFFITVSELQQRDEIFYRRIVVDFDINLSLNEPELNIFSDLPVKL